MNNSKTPTITPQNSASHKRGTINPSLYATGKPAKLRLLENARNHLAQHGVQQFCLNTVLTDCDISKEQFNDLFGNKRALIRAVFSDLYSKLSSITCAVRKDDYSPCEQVIFYAAELKRFFSEQINLELTHHLATGGKRLYKSYCGLEYLFFQDLFRKSLSMLMAEVIESKVAWSLCEKYAKKLRIAATKDISTLKAYVDWISDEILAHIERPH